MSLWTIPWLCKYSRPSISWQKYLGEEGGGNKIKPKSKNVLAYRQIKILNTLIRQTCITVTLTVVATTNPLELQVKTWGWGLTRELEILEIFSLGRCPTFLASHKRNIPSPYTWVGSQGCVYKSKMYMLLERLNENLAHWATMFQFKTEEKHEPTGKDIFSASPHCREHQPTGLHFCVGVFLAAVFP